MPLLSSPDASSSVYRHKLDKKVKREWERETILTSRRQLRGKKISRAAGGEGEDGGSVQLAVMVNDTGIFPNLTIV